MAAQTQQTAVAKNGQQQQVITIKQLLSGERFMRDLKAALPRHCNPDRQLRVMLTTINKNPKLAQCNQESLFACLLSCSQYGLEPDGRVAHLIPFWNSKKNSFDCQLIIDYKGIAELVMRSGLVSFIHADKICENDVFVYNKGQIEKHEINWKEDRGAPYAYYAVVRFKDGGEKSDVMTMAEVEKVRKRSKSANDGPWVTDFDEMAKKSVFRRLSKWTPWSAEVKNAVDTDLDEIVDELEERFRTAKVVAPANVVQLPEAKTDAPGEQAGSGAGPTADELEAQQEAAAQEEQKRLAAEKAAQTEAAKSATKPAETAATTAPPQTTAAAAPVNPPPTKTKVEPWNSAVHKPQLKAKLEAAKLTEAQLCGYLKESFLVEGCLTIDDVEGSAPSRLAQVLAKFETVAPKIAAMPGKSSQ